MNETVVKDILKTKTLADISEKFNDTYIKNKEAKEHEKLWVCFYPGCKYDLISQELTHITLEDNINNILNICSHFEDISPKEKAPSQEVFRDIEEINRRKTYIDSIFNFLKTQNKKITLQNLKRLLIQHLAQINAEQEWIPRAR